MEKQVIHAEVPSYDQQCQYVVELPPVEYGDHIFIGCEVRDMELDNEGVFNNPTY